MKALSDVWLKIVLLVVCLLLLVMGLCVNARAQDCTYGPVCWEEADDYFLRLDGTNDPVTGEVQFDEDIFGPDTSECSYTSFTISAGPINCTTGDCVSAGTSDFAFSDEGTACTNGFMFALEENGGAPPLWEFHNRDGTVPATMPTGESTITACLINVVDFGLLVTVYLPGSDSCSTFVAGVQSLSANAYVVDEDVDFFTLQNNGGVCEWAYTPDAGFAIQTDPDIDGACPGEDDWDDPPTIADDAQLQKVWKITKEGVVTTEGGVTSGGVGTFEDVIVNDDLSVTDHATITGGVTIRSAGLPLGDSALQGIIQANFSQDAAGLNFYVQNWFFAPSANPRSPTYAIYGGYEMNYATSPGATVDESYILFGNASVREDSGNSVQYAIVPGVRVQHSVGQNLNTVIGIIEGYKYTLKNSGGTGSNAAITNLFAYRHNDYSWDGGTVQNVYSFYSGDFSAKPWVVNSWGLYSLDDVYTGRDFSHGAAGNVGFFGTAPIAQTAAYTLSGWANTRALTPGTTTLTNTQHVLATLINDLQLYGLLQ